MKRFKAYRMLRGGYWICTARSGWRKVKQTTYIRVLRTKYEVVDMEIW